MTNAQAALIAAASTRTSYGGADLPTAEQIEKIFGIAEQFLTWLEEHRPDDSGNLSKDLLANAEAYFRQETRRKR
jgi:hypothetical protein